ncbi:MAG: hypothetical protein K9J37_12700 [Saprospiraceae bacterium]|nr:hypothetical protein [Saprospiraceae bacterium]MCF8250769.1 hypothetical protein [Saprospiraceae bacterium]MCF8282181.1 hypothetical protein [Bacteroidales bacterium]MCF8312570.1 hypothetical protein [Saprospiraceae bacterium]MCF8440899.1 hypothetical protein [Saprospiraceae bacterium]
MNRPLFFALLFSSVFVFSCSNDFDVNAKWQDIPVVYGLLDISDTAHYIRVERAFLDPNADATVLAKIPDSIFYENAIVKLERVSNGDVFTLQKVDGNKWGYPRDSGIFATDPNWLYRIDSAVLLLKEGEKIRLRIDRDNGLPEVTSQAVILSPLKLNNPQQNSNGFAFLSNAISKTNINWSAADSAYIFDATLYVRYAEYPKVDPSQLVEKTIEWPWARGLRRESNSNVFEAEKFGFEFYELMKSNIEVDVDMKRVFLGIDVEIIAGGLALQNYVNVSLANTGITSSGEIPTYSNLSEGQGLFDSANKFRRNGIGINDKTRDSLKMGYLTKNLNF